MKISIAQLRAAALAAACTIAPAGAAVAQDDIGGAIIQGLFGTPGGWQGGVQGAEGSWGTPEWVPGQPGIIPQVIDGLGRQPQPTQNYYYDDGYNYNNNNRVYRPSQPAAPPPPPPVTPKKNAVPVKPLTPVANRVSANVFWMSPQDARSAIQDGQADIDDRDIANKDINRGEATDALNDPSNLKINAPDDLSPQDKARIAGKVGGEGKFDANDKQKMLDAGYTPEAIEHMEEISEATRAQNEFVASAKDGEATQAQKNAARDAIERVYGPNSPEANRAVDNLDQIGTDSGVINFIKNMDPGNPPPPTGPDVWICVLPTLPGNTVIPLSSNTAVVGANMPVPGGKPAFVNCSLAEALGLPAGMGPVPDSDAKLVTEGVLLMNNTDTTVNYVVNNTAFSMAAGYSQALPSGTKWVVSFDKGNGAGTGKYTLSDGTYAFDTNGGGWELYSQTFKIEIDNSQNGGEFNYVLNNTAQAAAAGQKKEHSGKYPFIVRFDRGDGEIKQKKLLKGVYSVGIDVADNTFDLFSAERDNTTSIVGNKPSSPPGASSSLNLFGNSGGGSSGRLNLFGTSASERRFDNAPWQATDIHGGRRPPLLGSGGGQ